MKQLFSTLFLLLIIHQTVSAEVYKWIDETGKTRFSDKAPDKTPAETIGEQLEKTNVDDSSKNLNTSFVSTEKTADEANHDAEVAQRKKEANAPICAKLKEGIDLISSGNRVAFFDENGNERKVLEKDLGKELEKMQEHYKQLNCE